MAADDSWRGRRPGAHTHLRQASQDTWDALRSEEGTQQTHTPDGQPVHITRRGSFMLQQQNGDGTHDVAILHSTRTAHLIEQREAFAAEVATAKRPRGEDRANAYRPPDFPRSAHGHDARVTQYSGTAQEGFTELHSATYSSGKAGGTFSDRRMSSLHAAGWPEGSAEDTHHSEADYTASQLSRPIHAPPGGVLVHQMKGVNDMCTTCRTGVASVLTPVGGSHFATYMGEQPFRSQKEWREQAGPVATGPGNIVRSRPEQMMRDHDQADHVNRAGFMVDLRRSGPLERRPPVPSFSAFPPDDGSDRKPRQPPPGGPGSSSGGHASHGFTQMRDAFGRFTSGRR